MAAPAQASPTCEPRSAAHITKHGGLKADSAWHIAHGERPTCDPDEKHRNREGAQRAPTTEKKKKNDKPRRYHRDRFGIHCKRFHCG